MDKDQNFILYLAIIWIFRFVDRDYCI